MTAWLAAAGGIGGVVALLATIVVIGRGVFRQITATEDNTEAVKGLTKKVEQLSFQLASHETRLSVLEDRGRQRGRGGFLGSV